MLATHPVSRLCAQQQFDAPDYAVWCERLADTPRPHRKQWEFVYIAQTLHACGMLQAGKLGVGFGVGREPLPALFASLGARVLATDAPQDSEGAWSRTQQYADALDALPWQGICERDVFADRGAFEAVDLRV